MNRGIIGNFLQHLTHFKKYSKSTLKIYTNHLNDFLTYIAYKKWIEYSLYDVTIPDCTDYLSTVSQRKITWSSRYYGQNTIISDGTLSTYAWSIIWLFKRLQIYGERPCLNPQLLPKIRVARPKIEALNDEQVREIIELPEKIEKRRDIALRNKLYILMLYTTWCRATEILTLSYSDIDRFNKEIVIKWKGKKFRSVFITDEVLEVMDQYIEERSKPYINSLWIQFEAKKSEYIFTTLCDTQEARPIAYISIMNMFLKYSQHTEKKINAHMLRHSFATRMLRAGVRERYIQEALGHEYITTTQRYLTVTNKDLSDVHRSVFW